MLGKDKPSFLLKKSQPDKEDLTQKSYTGIAGKIQEALEKTLEELDIKVSQINLEHPASEEHGDYSSNVALATFESEKRKAKSEKSFNNPRELAQMIVDRLLDSKELKDIVSEISVAGPGFINFKLSEKALLSELTTINEKKDRYGDLDEEKGIKFSVEHTGPNTNKPLHIGHLRNGILGMSLVRLLRKVGYETLSSNINNDRGIHIIKAMWAYQKYGNKLTPKTMTVDDWNNIIKKTGVPEIKPFLVGGKIKPDHLLGLFYIIGNQMEETNEESKKEMHQMLIDWEAGETEVRNLWKRMNDWFYQGAKMTLDALEISFDKEWYESEIYDKGKAIVEEGVARGVFKRFVDGHVEAILEPYGLPNVVLLRSNGTALYITQDFELMRQRMIDEKIKYNLILTDSGQNLRFRQLYKICELLGYGKPDQFIHIGYGTVRIPGGKMSSRLGNVILADELIENMKSLAMGLMSGKKIGTEFTSVSEKEEIAKEVGIGALKYAVLKVNPLMDMTFDLEKSISLEGDSGPYLQYTYARCRSVIEKANGKESFDSAQDKQRAKQDLNLQLTTHNSQLNSEELAILRWIYRFPEVLGEVAITYSPNLVATFLFELAKRYNAFYHKHPILKVKSVSSISYLVSSKKNNEEQKLQNTKYDIQNTSSFRLLLTAATSCVLKNGLELLGINVLERM